MAAALRDTENRGELTALLIDAVEKSIAGGTESHYFSSISLLSRWLAGHDKPEDYIDQFASALDRGFARFPDRAKRATLFPGELLWDARRRRDAAKVMIRLADRVESAPLKAIAAKAGDDFHRRISAAIDLQLPLSDISTLASEGIDVK